MTTKSTGQITIVDVTDAYSVMLTSETYTFVGENNGTSSGLTCSTQAVAYCGSNRCSNVTVVSANISCPTGISAAVSGSGTNTVTITFTTTGSIKEACEATIPVEVDGITINKKFSFAVALKGNTGDKGNPGDKGDPGTPGSDGADAITLTITSSNGTIFKNNSGSTVLTAHVFVGAVEQSITSAGVCGSLGSIKWYKSGTTAAIATAKTLTVSAASVTNSAVYTCQLEG